MVESILRAAGYRTALFTSPHTCVTSGNVSDWMGKAKVSSLVFDCKHQCLMNHRCMYRHLVRPGGFCQVFLVVPSAIEIKIR